MTVDMHRRVHNYQANGRQTLTPRQVRRINHKAGHQGSADYPTLAGVLDDVNANPCRLCWTDMGYTTDDGIGTGNTGRLYWVPIGTKP